MSDVFFRILNLSITASWLILAVLLVRFIFRKAPRGILCLLWLIVAVRLVIPFDLESALSLIPESEPITEEMILEEDPADRLSYESPAYIPDEIPSYIPDESPAPQPTAPVIEDVPTYVTPELESVDPIIETVPPIAEEEPEFDFASALSIAWIAGVAAMLIYCAISYIRVWRRVADSIPGEGNIRISERIASPFILGIIRPKIYLPSGVTGETADYLIAHERSHLHRFDHLIKPLGFLILSVYWFNPLVWIAYILLCRDIELACDERVLRKMDDEGRRAYAAALLEFGVEYKIITATPLAFGEVGVKSRIKNALNYKKPMLWVIIALIVAICVIVVCFLTNPISADEAIGAETEETTETQSAPETDADSETQSETEAKTETTETELDTETHEITETEALTEETEVAEQTTAPAPVTTPPPETTAAPVTTTPQETEPAVTEPAETTSQKVVFESIPNGGMSLMQENHQTPEEIETKTRHATFQYVNVYVKDVVYDAYSSSPYYRDKLGIESYSNTIKAGLKVWLCYEDGEKIDYLYTNSEGIAQFKIYDADEKYIFYFEGSDKLVPRYSEVFRNTYYWEYKPYHVARSFEIYSYPKDYPGFKVYAVDEDTGEPLSAVSFTITGPAGEIKGVTNEKGICECETILSISKDEHNASSIVFELDGYSSRSLKYGISIFDKEISLPLYKNTVHEITVKFINSDTGEPVENAYVSLGSVFDSFDEESVIHSNDPKAEGNYGYSNSEGIVTCSITERNIRNGATLECRCPTENGVSGLSERVELVAGKNEYIVEVKQAEHGLYFP